MEFLLLWAIKQGQLSCLSSRLLLWSSPWWPRCQLGGHTGASLPNVARQAAPTAVGRDAPGTPRWHLSAGYPHPARDRQPLRTVWRRSCWTSPGDSYTREGSPVFCNCPVPLQGLFGWSQAVFVPCREQRGKKSLIWIRLSSMPLSMPKLPLLWLLHNRSWALSELLIIPQPGKGCLASVHRNTQMGTHPNKV